MAPCYITICGVQPGEGAIITRNRDSEENVTLPLLSFHFMT
jgi:hypothetical protein